MIYQRRIYEICEHNKAAFHARFRDHAARIMRKYGFDIVAMWEAKSGRAAKLLFRLLKGFGHLGQILNGQIGSNAKLV